MIRQVTGADELAAIGIASAGPIDREAGTINAVNMRRIHGAPVVARLQDAFGVPVNLVGDAVALALGEWWGGAARGADTVLAVVVSTGIGGGIVQDGRAADGRTGNAGHIGHMIVDPNGPPCPCGAIGCLEAIASGPSSVRWALEQGWTGTDHTGVGLSAAAHAGDRIALAALARAGEAVGRTIASVTTLLDLDVAVVGGGLTAAGEPLCGPLRAAFDANRTLAYTRRCRLEFTSDTAASALLGAAVPHLSRGVTGGGGHGAPAGVLARDRQ